MKKKILFVIDSLEIGGAEKSLVSLLSTIDSNKYDIDLQLFKYGGAFEALLPSYINILPPLPYNEFCSKPLFENLKNTKLSFIISRLLFSVKIRISKSITAASYAVINWKTTRKCFDRVAKEYDVAVAYSQNVSTFYVAECVSAKRKLAWVNEMYRPKKKHLSFLEGLYKEFTYICCVSDPCLKQFSTVFPAISSRVVRMMDINNVSTILQLSQMESTAKEEMFFDGIKILTVARLVTEKGFDIAVEACKELKNRKLNFKWFVIGDGYYKATFENLIQENNLSDDFILLGSRSNPYPYFKETDIYVQTSKLEGFGLTVAEAKTFNLPIVSTNFSAVFSQLSHRNNGIITEMTGLSVAEGIVELINNTELKNRIIDNLKNEKKGNAEEISVLYHLIEE